MSASEEKNAMETEKYTELLLPEKKTTVSESDLKTVVRRDDLYPKGFIKRAEYKLANLMKHGYELAHLDDCVKVVKGNDDLLITARGDVYKKVIY